MLVLTRRPKQIIRISDNIVVEVLVVNGNEVKLGIAAPKNISVMRGELSGECRKVVPLDKEVSNEQ